MNTYNIIKVTKVLQTETKPDRVKIEARLSKPVIISMDGKALPTALVYLQRQGFEVIGDGEGKNCFYLVSTTFKELK